MLKRELYLKRIEMYIGRDVAKLITGVRGAGKTVILHQLMEELRAGGVPEENIVYLNFESLLYAYFTKEEQLREMLAAFLEQSRGHSYIFLDEPQRIAGWASVCAEMMNLFDCELFVCASGNALFYDGFAKALGYRYVRFNVYPLVFGEYLELVRGREGYEALSQGALFADYIKSGGFPAVYGMSGEAAADYRSALYSEILLKDAVQCNKLRDISHIDKIMAFVFSHIGEQVSPKAMRDFVKEQGVTISVDTVYSCLDALMGAGLIYRVPRYDIKNDKQLETQETYYVCDLAMRHAVYGEEELSGDAVMENTLQTELLSRGFSTYVGKEGKHRIDFMAVKAEDRTYLNVCTALSDKEAVKREFGPLKRIRDNYFKMVLSMEEQTPINQGGIINFPFLSFLVQS